MTNLKKQFKTFFFNEKYSKLFINICLIIVFFGAINMISTISSEKQNVDINIIQKEKKLKNEGCHLQYKKYEYGNRYISGVSINCNKNEITELKKLYDIKNMSTWQLAGIKFSFGWLGIIALISVFLINIIIITIKTLIKFSRTKIKIIKNNIKNMPVFQRYLFIITASIFITLILILLILISK